MKKIEIIGVTKYFDELYTLGDISLVLNQNEFITILGPSGSGKSTLFNIIAGIERADTGKIIIDGEDYTGRTGRVSYMQQKDLLLPWKSILDNTIIPLTIKGVGKNKARKEAKKLFSLFGLEGFEDHYPNELSGGMKQRAAILRTYLFSKDIMLLDEPFAGLDAITKRKMHQWLLDILDNLKASILFITHDIDEAIFLSDKIYILSERPAKIKKVFNIDIPKPRDNNSFASREFMGIKKEILSLL